jgi:membrane-associated protease RseP (regulator of RpoE activity)
MGALISMREPIPDRRSLLDIGIAGPISGFLVAIPVLIIGLHLSDFIAIADIPEGAPILGDNIFILLLSEIMFDIPSQYTINLHPTAFAGWVGLLITAINLLPAGQLDGGHVARAVLKENHRYASFATVLFLAGLTFFGFGNWLILLLLLIFLIGTQHPPPLNEYISLDAKRKALALLALIIFILSFTPTPVS